MANATIPMLPQAVGLTGAEQLEAVQGGSSVRVTAQQIANLLASGAGGGTVTSGSFLGTLTGFLTPLTGTCFYTIVDTAVILYIPAMTGTSNSASMTLTGLPFVIQPVTDKIVMMANLQNNSAVKCIGTAHITSAGVIDFTLVLSPASASSVLQSGNLFTAGGSNGIGFGSVITYDLN